MPRPKGYVVSPETKARIAATKAASRIVRLETRTVERSITVRSIVVRQPIDPNKKYSTKLYNKGLQPCPNCGFPEAYGGFCEDCGWFAPVYYLGRDGERHQWFPGWRSSKA